MKGKEKQPKQAPQGEEQQVAAAKIVKKKAARGAKKAKNLSDVVRPKGGPGQDQPGLVLFTLRFVYKNLYILGISLLRRLLGLRRKCRRLWAVGKGHLFALQHRLARFAGGNLRRLSHRVRAPLHRIRDAYRSQLPVIQAQRAQGGVPVKAYLPVLEMAGRVALKILTTIFNYAAPVVAAVILVAYVQDLLRTPIALKLEYDGEELGYIHSESVFEDAAQIVRERTLNQEDQVIAVGVPSFELAEPATDRYLDQETIADIIISHSGQDIETAFGLFVGGRLVGAVTDKDAVLDALTEIKAQGATGNRGEQLEFAKSIRLAEALYPASSVRDPSVVIDKLRSNDDEEDFYEVQPEDTPWEIAEKLGMPYRDLLALNPQIEEALLPGDELKTKVAKPFLPVQSVYTITETEEIDFEEEVVDNITIPVGEEEVTQEGVNGERLVVVEVTAVNGIPQQRNIIDTTVLVEPVKKRIVRGSKEPEPPPSAEPSQPSGSATQQPKPADTAPSAQAGGGSKFIWPTVPGTRATTYAGHGYAADIAYTGGGVPVYAAASGTVRQVKNGWVNYGHYIVIDHGDGYSTLYAHNSVNYVSVGDTVQQGDVIGLMGRTGRATGNHVHFEVRYNNRAIDPIQFIGTSR